MEQCRNDVTIRCIYTAVAKDASRLHGFCNLQNDPFMIFADMMY